MKCDLQEINFYPPSVHLLSSLICLGEMTPLVTIWIFGGGEKKEKGAVELGSFNVSGICDRRCVKSEHDK